MAFNLMRGFTTWGTLFGFAGIIAGISNAICASFGERRKWIREIKLDEWRKVISASEEAVFVAMRMPRRELGGFQKMHHFSKFKEQASGATDALIEAQSQYREAATKVEELYSLFNSTILIFPKLCDSGAISAHADFRTWFFSNQDEGSVESFRDSREAGGRMIAALRCAAYENLDINLPFEQRWKLRGRRLKRYYRGSSYPHHLGKTN